jgi:hypothetical protein
MSRVLVVAFVVATAAFTSAQPSRRFALDTAAGIRAHNVSVTPATHAGRRGVRVEMAVTVREPFQGMTSEQRDAATKTTGTVEQLAIIEGITFDSGVIEVELAGTPDTSVFKDARGFVGVAFRLQSDLKTYDAFYLRPTNGRADDQIRRNHSTQYISHPDWTWFRLRNETPKKYEAYVDLVPNEWTQVKIEVQQEKARLFVHGQTQPTLLVNDLKTGPSRKGAIALWIDVGTQAHFRNLTVTPTVPTDLSGARRGRPAPGPDGRASGSDDKR